MNPFLLSLTENPKVKINALSLTENSKMKIFRFYSIVKTTGHTITIAEIELFKINAYYLYQSQNRNR